MTAAIIVGMLTAGGVYLILQRGIVRVALGFVLLGHAGTTLLVAAGGVSRRALPFVGESGAQADPLPQAFALTAIVISFALTAFLLTLAYRARDVMGHDDVEDPTLLDADPDDVEFAATEGEGGGGPDGAAGAAGAGRAGRSGDAPGVDDAGTGEASP